MGDVVSWGLINNVKKNVKDVKNDLSTIKTGVADIQSDMTQLSTDVNDAVENIQTTVDNAPVGGILPAPLNGLNSQSNEEGIELSYQITDWDGFFSSPGNYGISASNMPDNIFDRAKGVMFRYSPDEYPKSPTDGVLAGIDEDLYNNTGTGTSGFGSKPKTLNIAGLTSNETYYISAFPYSFSGVYFVSPYQTGPGHTSWAHRTKCTWTGTKGTLTVTITQDYDYKTLGEITVTATPASGDESPVTKSRTGPGDVTFSLEGNKAYRLSFSTAQYFTKPQNQSVSVYAGRPNTASAEYRFSASFSECTWHEIKEIADDGNCDLFFSLGDKKSISIKYISTPTSDYRTEPTLSEVTTNLVIVDFNAMEKENGEKANLQLCTEDVVTAFSSAYIVDNPNGYWLGAWCSPEQDIEEIDYPYMRKYVESELNNILPDELLNIITTVKVSAKYWRWRGGTSSSPDGLTTGSVNSKLFPPPQQFSYWSTDEKRKKKDAKTKSIVKWSKCDGFSYVDVYDFQYRTYSENGTESGDSNYSGGLNNVIRHPMCVCI